MDRKDMKQMLFLTGFMGAGKTTVGKALGKVLALDVLDTDQLIETSSGQSVRDIFKIKGEPFFRRCEEETLRALAKRDKQAIITTGGGLVVSGTNRAIMKKSGIMIYLHCDIERINNRLLHDTTRPLLQQNPGQAFVKLYKSRLPYYLDADFVIDTTMKSVPLIVKEIIFILDRLPAFGASCEQEIN